MSVLVMKFVLREWMGCFNMFQVVSRGIQVYFPIYSTMGRIVGLIVSDVFLLYLGYRYRIGKIWL